MRKTLLTLLAVVLAGSVASAQTVIYENGPQVIFAGGGVGGADVSHLHDGQTSYGTGHQQLNGYRIADDVVISSTGGWYVDSIAFYAYQTGSGLVSTITGVNINIWDGSPDDPNSTVVFGDGVSNFMIETDWSGIYRTGDFGGACDPTTCDARPIMRNVITVGMMFPAGTYWLDWQTDGSGASGPWAPPINIAGVTTTGNALQYDPAATAWNALTDVGPVGFPFQVVGTILTGINEANINNAVTVFPNPMATNTTVTVNNQNLAPGETYTFVMYDILGNVVREMQNITDKQFTVERGSLTQGAYFYDMKKGNESLKKGKLIVR